MPAVSASAPGKIILFGEHAVVYGQAAIAIPVHQLKATAYFQADPSAPPAQVQIEAPDIALHTSLADLPADHPFAILIRLVCERLGIKNIPAVKIKIVSTIPIAAGLGSGTAVSVALIRGLLQFVGAQLNNPEISAITYEVEKSYHGTPSGIDNTVVTYASPIFFLKNNPPQALKVGADLYFIIADSGIKSKTSEAVGMVRAQREEQPQKYNELIGRIGTLARQAREAIQSGGVAHIGALMNINHTLLADLGVSSDKLNALTHTARQAGALGAKLSGAGLGGNIIALVDQQTVEPVRKALTDAGVVNTYFTKLPVTR